MRSNLAHQLFFIFQFKNILRSNLNFSTSYGHLTDLKSLLGLLLVSFIWLGEKISLKYWLIIIISFIASKIVQFGIIIEGLSVLRTRTIWRSYANAQISTFSESLSLIPSKLLSVSLCC